MSHIRNPPDETCTCEILRVTVGRYIWVRGKPCLQHPLKKAKPDKNGTS